MSASWMEGISQTFSKFFGTASKKAKYLRQMDQTIGAINALESVYEGFSESQIRQQTQTFRERYAGGESLDSLLVEAFALVREASKRVLSMRHFDVQLKGGIVLHRGMIAEMKTGEGKTLVATLPSYLNALTGRGVHLVTVNDYLAKRDSGHMRPLFEALGMTVGCIVQDLTSYERKRAYESDITYGTNNEFGFDYLRDNMKFSFEQMCQRPFNYAIVDEVDSILIDEARTPLIISGPAEDASQLYERVNSLIARLTPEDYEREEKNKSIHFTEQGYAHVEALVREHQLMRGTDLFQPVNITLIHHLNQSLKAQNMFQRDVDYIVKDGEVVIIDEFTGRMMKGRRYSDGLHQALEAKEGVEVQMENQTLASITFQNYFRMYPKLAGMTGTAETESAEFESTYSLSVIPIPTNKPVLRRDEEDEIFLTFEDKKMAIVQQVKACYERQQPVLVGTASIEKSEIFSQALTIAGIPHNVLNARHHEREASIIAQAGMPGKVTIATNMAGRGTDIKLGGHVESEVSQALTNYQAIKKEILSDDDPEVQAIRKRIATQVESRAQIARAAGGLFVLGTERHESRRIDNQLRGRSGRQGDPGESKFFISLEDDLMRIFGPNLALMNYSLKKNQEGSHEPITHPWITRALEKAQQRVEAQHFETRKHLLKYADVLNMQRKSVYEERLEIMRLQDVRPRIESFLRGVVDTLMELYTKKDTISGEASLQEALQTIFHESFPLEQWKEHRLDEEIFHHAKTILWKREEQTLEDDGTNLTLPLESSGEERDYRRQFEKSVLLKTLDEVWITHLNAIEHLRSGIHLQAYGQKDPLNEYKNEAFILFQYMTQEWHQKTLSNLIKTLRLDVEMSRNIHSTEVREEEYVNGENGAPLNHLPMEEFLQQLEEFNHQFSKDSKRVEGKDYKGENSGSLEEEMEKKGIEPPLSRNDLCPCGSNKRYKHCHGML